jgi:hypothetical protein
LLDPNSFPDILDFGRALRRRSRFSRLYFLFWLAVRVSNRLRLRIANRLGQHLEQLGLCLRLRLVAHKFTSATDETTLARLPRPARKLTD